MSLSEVAWFTRERAARAATAPLKFGIFQSSGRYEEVKSAKKKKKREKLAVNRQTGRGMIGFIPLFLVDDIFPSNAEQGIR